MAGNRGTKKEWGNNSASRGAGGGTLTAAPTQSGTVTTVTSRQVSGLLCLCRSIAQPPFFNRGKSFFCALTSSQEQLTTHVTVF